MKNITFLLCLCLTLILIPSIAYSDLEAFANPGASLSLSDYSFIGENSWDYCGRSVSNAGDIDGDGYDDILIGACYNDDGGTDAGKTYLLLGPTVLANGSADYTFIGENAEDHSGNCVSNAGDVDGDGLDDILIGATWNDDGGTDAGKTYLMLGSSISTGGPSMNYDFEFIGENSGDFSGHSVSSAGDVDGDGLDDILISACRNDDGGDYAGKTYLILGSSISPFRTSVDLSDADYSFIGENPSDYSGNCVSSAGDVDGDGLDDILIAAYGNNDGGTCSGKTCLILGSSIYNDMQSGNSSMSLATADYSFIGEDIDDWSGYSISSAGDIDGDGYSDILIGACKKPAPYYTGKAYIFLGSNIVGSTSPISLADADHSLIGENYSDSLGSSVSSAGDVDGDGLSDILISAPHNDDGGFSTGKTYLLLGSFISASGPSINPVDANYSFLGTNADYRSGHSISSAGDVDGDGLSDILIGAGWNNDGGDRVGKTYLIFSNRTIYVDCFYGSDTSGDGSYNNPYETISMGINMTGPYNVDKVIVRGGIYPENVSLGINTELVGQLRFGSLPPYITGDGTSEILVHGNYGASLKNFVVFNGGVQLDNIDGMLIQENVIFAGEHTKTYALQLLNDSDLNIIKNNIIYGEDISYARAVIIDQLCEHNEFINNTIHVRDTDSEGENDSICIYLEDYTYDNVFINNILQSETNLYWGGVPYGFYTTGTNLTATIKYNCTSGFNYGFTLDNTNINAYAFFNNMYPYGFDYTLDINSPCIDRGSISPVFNDPDGTRNDIGAYGGTNYLDFME